jgi:protein tyrosine phosphatase
LSFTAGLKIYIFNTFKLRFEIANSAGVGRTGTFILIDSALRSAKQDGQVNLLAMLAHMRTQRPNMVDNEVKAKIIFNFIQAYNYFVDI